MVFQGDYKISCSIVIIEMNGLAFITQRHRRKGDFIRPSSHIEIIGYLTTCRVKNVKECLDRITLIFRNNKQIINSNNIRRPIPQRLISD